MKTKKTCLTEIIKQNEITQEQLAKNLGVTQQAVSKWCTNLSVPKTKDLSKIAKALGVTVDELLCCFEKEK